MQDNDPLKGIYYFGGMLLLIFLLIQFKQHPSAFELAILWGIKKITLLAIIFYLVFHLTELISERKRQKENEKKEREEELANLERKQQLQKEEEKERLKRQLEEQEKIKLEQERLMKKEQYLQNRSAEEANKDALKHFL